jgi:SAM-dependent methyltransferase
VDLMGEINLRHTNPFDTIYPFLRKALHPEPSANRNPDRLDVVVEVLQVHPTSDTKVLDLGCGDCLLLEKLLSQCSGVADHRQGEGQCDRQVTCSYYGVDFKRDIDRWTSLDEKKCKKCFPLLDFIEISLTNLELLKVALKCRGPFDWIFLANVLHELSPKKGLQLIELLFDQLSQSGKLVIIDPDGDWCLSPHAWTAKTEMHLENLPVEWEMDAVWLSHTDAEAVLRSIGFDATVRLLKRSMHIWTAVVTRPIAAVGPNPDLGRERLIERLERQVKGERKKIGERRRALQKHFLKCGTMSGELLIKTFEFFAACASQCRREEALEELRPMAVALEEIRS